MNINENQMEINENLMKINDTCAWTPNSVSIQSLLCNLWCGASVGVRYLSVGTQGDTPGGRYTNPKKVRYLGVGTQGDTPGGRYTNPITMESNKNPSSSCGLCLGNNQF